MRWTLRLSVIAVAIVGALAQGATAMADGITNSGDDLRTGWYPDAQISPQTVTGGTFGELWSANVAGQVYAQPLVATNADGSPESVVVTTEQNNVYALSPSTGAQQWTTNLGTPWNPADIGCADIQPYRGSTSTPVIDTATNTVYLTHKTYGASGQAEWFMDALNIASGAEQPNFPVQLTGNADNFPTLAFDARTEDQRPGLLMMNGVVYAAFGGNCDITPWQGWVFGVSGSTGQITARWADNPAGNGAGIWQSGVGLMSDGPGALMFLSGNGGSPTEPGSSASLPGTFGESAVTLNVGASGQLTPVDFFAPFDVTQLDRYDADFGAGAVVGLPPADFGTASIPNLGVVAGKEGYVYLLNLDNLGGFELGTGGGDNVVQRLGPFGGVWGRAGVWPGDGGYIYIPTSTGLSNGGLLDVYRYGVDGSGAPSLASAGNASTTFGWGSGSPVITSAGTSSGSALVWMIWSPNRSGAGAQLQAYEPVPTAGALQQVYGASIGTSSNYSMPGVGDNGDLYVGTRGGTVLAFGSPVTGPLSGSSLSFPATQTGSSSGPQTLTVTASRPVVINGISSSSSQFTTGTPSQSLPASLGTGDTITVPVTFAPTQTGPIGGNITLTTDSGTVSIPVSGTGESSAPDLVASQRSLSLGGTIIGNPISGTVTLTNEGNAPLTINDVVLPNAPFSTVGAPADGDVLAPTDSLTIEVDFAPTAVGQSSDELQVDSTGGNVTIGLGASAAAPPVLQISGESNDYGDVQLGTTTTRTFTLTNTGGSDLTINKSKPPFGGEFTATTSLPEGTTIAPDQSVTETVAFTPTTSGPANGIWDITGNDGSGLQAVQFTGNGVTPPMLQLSAAHADFGNLDVGSTATKSFTLTNIGGSKLTITHSAPPPSGGEFVATSSLPDGTTIAAGQTVSETVTFRPTTTGAASAEWDITGNDGSGQQTIQFTGDGVIPASTATTPTLTTTTSTTTTTTSTTARTPTSTNPAPGTAQPEVNRLQAPTIWPAATTYAATRHSYITWTAVIRRTSHFTLERASAGRWSRGRCLSLTAGRRHRGSCTRWTTLTSFTYADKVGVNQLWLVAVMPANRLIAGTYRLRTVLDDAKGRPHVFITEFKIK